MALHIKKGDIVMVIAGDDAGERGKVLSVDPMRQTVIVEGRNRVFKHVRPSRRNPQGGRLQVERPIHISNVQPLSGDKAGRVKFIVEENGEKKRVGPGGTIGTVKRAKG
ncbi:MAG: 50S ribosomal protein L24 [Sedimentisphaerales bacterium]|nr:50S ribosomal protein L24 [Sedimentisphaerales bacterium]